MILNLGQVINMVSYEMVRNKNEKLWIFRTGKL